MATTHTVEFGYLGDSRPVPDLTIDTDDPNEFHRAVVGHAVPYLRPVLEKMGRPEAADCIFQTNKDRTMGQFMWLDFQSGNGARFCAARITTVQDEAERPAS